MQHAAGQLILWVFSLAREYGDIFYYRAAWIRYFLNHLT